MWFHSTSLTLYNVWHQQWWRHTQTHIQTSKWVMAKASLARPLIRNWIVVVELGEMWTFSRDHFTQIRQFTRWKYTICIECHLRQNSLTFFSPRTQKLMKKKNWESSFAWKIHHLKESFNFSHNILSVMCMCLCVMSCQHKFKKMHCTINRAKLIHFRRQQRKLLQTIWRNGIKTTNT